LSSGVQVIEVSMLTFQFCLYDRMRPYLLVGLDAEPVNQVVVKRLVRPPCSPCRLLWFATLQRPERVSHG